MLQVIPPKACNTFQDAKDLLAGNLLDLWRYNKRQLAAILFAAASCCLKKLLADPKYCGGRVGMLAALHTWSQTLAAHAGVIIANLSGTQSSSSQAVKWADNC
jgi:hypothetical protein